MDIAITGFMEIEEELNESLETRTLRVEQRSTYYFFREEKIDRYRIIKAVKLKRSKKARLIKLIRKYKTNKRMERE